MCLLLLISFVGMVLSNDNLCPYQYPETLTIKYPIVKTLQILVPNCKHTLSCNQFKLKRVQQKVYETIEKSVYRVKYKCCFGYSLDSKTQKCIRTSDCSSIECFNNGKCNNKTKSCECKNEFIGPQCQYDINECVFNNGNCSHECVNTYGSFYCKCRDGFRLARDEKSCVDVNECLEANTCEHDCINSAGGYRCECKSGFKLGQDLHQCLIKIRESIQHEFECKSFANSTHFCECLSKKVNCKEIKINLTQNSKFRVISNECKPGYWGYKCSRICPLGRFGLNCIQICNCSRNTLKCSHIDGKCECKRGFYGNDCKLRCDNVNGNCLQKKQRECICKNKSICLQSGSCLCLPGYYGINCQHKCPKGYYGMDCLKKCSCENAYNCNHVNGTCDCLSGFYGKNCEKKVL